MDIFKINQILHQIDPDIIITNQVINKINKYIIKLFDLFKNIQVINNTNEFYNSVDIFFYNLELKHSIYNFLYTDNNNPIILYKFSNKNNIQKLYSLMFEYIIYDLLDMMYCYISIHNEEIITTHTLHKIINNDTDFKILNSRNKILFLENDIIIPQSYFKRIIKKILPNRKFKIEFYHLFQKYIEYKINLYLFYTYNNTHSKTIKHIQNNNLIYFPNIINIECDSTIHYLK